MCAADISELFALSDKGGSRLGGVGVETERNGGRRERERERRGARSYRKPLRSSSSSSSPLGGRALPDCRREVAEVWPRS